MSRRLVLVNFFKGFHGGHKRRDGHPGGSPSFAARCLDELTVLAKRASEFTSVLQVTI